MQIPLLHRFMTQRSMPMSVASRLEWTANNDMLCWDLPTFGRALGTNPACSTAKQTKPDRLALRNQQAPDLTFATVLVLNP